MRILKISKREYKKYTKFGFTYVLNNKFLKFDKDYLDHFRKFNRFDGTSSIDKVQIQMLCDRQEYIDDVYLPEGIIELNGKIVGVIYPYFEGYKTFKNIKEESISRILSNFKKAIYYNEKLVQRGIYNLDLNANNVLYKDDDVKLIDLDGKYVIVGDDKHISSAKIYSYFFFQLRKILLSKIEECEYTKEELKNIREFIIENTCLISEEDPLTLIDNIGKIR